MAFDAAAASNVVFGLLSLGVAIAVFAAGPGRACNRAFALLLSARGLLTISNRLAEMWDAPQMAAGLYGVAATLSAMMPAIIATFLWAYLRPDTVRRGAPILLGLGAVVAVFVVSGPCIGACPQRTFQSFMSSGLALAEAGAALLLVWRLTTAAPRAAETHWLLALAFMSLAIIDGLLPLTLVMSLPLAWSVVAPDLWAKGAFVLFGIGALLGVGAAIWLGLGARRLPRFAGRGRVPIVLAVVMLTASSLPLWGLRHVDPRSMGIFVAGILRLVMPALAGYGLVRYGLFTAGVRTRRTVNRSLLAAIFVAVYFLASESAAAFVEDRTGNAFVGIGAAAMLLLVLVPLESWLRRFAEDVAPSAPEPSVPLPDRRRFFEEQMEIVWLDGKMGFKERLMMDRLRHQLGLPVQEAAAIEEQAAQRFARSLGP